MSFAHTEFNGCANRAKRHVHAPGKCCCINWRVFLKRWAGRHTFTRPANAAALRAANPLAGAYGWRRAELQADATNLLAWAHVFDVPGARLPCSSHWHFNATSPRSQGKRVWSRLRVVILASTTAQTRAGVPIWRLIQPASASHEAYPPRFAQPVHQARELASVAWRVQVAGGHVRAKASCGVCRGVGARCRPRQLPCGRGCPCTAKRRTPA